VSIVVVHLSAAAESRLRELGEAAYPNEGCGVMIGRADATPVAIESVTSGRNLVTDRSHDRYLLDPGDIVSAERSAREQGMDIVGFWHTHPDHPAWPSQFDADHAWTDYVYVICRVAAGVCEQINAFSLPEMGEPFAQMEMATGDARTSR
jgi:proteasome lid subunit RPN8/RPN11